MKVPSDKSLLSLWAEVVKLYDHNMCAVCGKTEYLNAHHIFSRNNRSTRYDLDNGVALCPSHHTFNNHMSAHKAPAEFIEWIKEKRGIEWYDRLRLKAKSVKKYTSDDFVEIRHELLKVKKELSGGTV